MLWQPPCQPPESPRLHLCGGRAVGSVHFRQSASELTPEMGLQKAQFPSGMVSKDVALSQSAGDVFLSVVEAHFDHMDACTADECVECNDHMTRTKLAWTVFSKSRHRHVQPGQIELLELWLKRQRSLPKPEHVEEWVLGGQRGPERRDAGKVRALISNDRCQCCLLPRADCEWNHLAEVPHRESKDKTMTRTNQGWNPSGIADTVSLNGRESLGDAQDTVELLLEQMDKLNQNQRITVFQILGDFFCPRCGVEQPKGDCQCDKPRFEEYRAAMRALGIEAPSITYEEWLWQF